MKVSPGTWLIPRTWRLVASTRIAPVVGESRKIGHEVGTDQLERVPPIAPAASEVVATVEHDVLAAGVTQMVAHDEPGLPGADDDRVR